MLYVSYGSNNNNTKKWQKMSLPFERSIAQDSIHSIPQIKDPRNQTMRWECQKCKLEFHIPPIQNNCSKCGGEVVRQNADTFTRNGQQPHFNLYTPTAPQIIPPNNHFNNTLLDRHPSHPNIPNLCYLTTVETPDETYDMLSACWFKCNILILLRTHSEPLLSYKELAGMLKGVNGTILKDVLTSIRGQAVCLHDYQMECFRKVPHFNRIKTSFLPLQLFFRICSKISLTPPDSIKQLLHIHTDDTLVYSLPTYEDTNMPTHSINRNSVMSVPNGAMQLQHDRPYRPPMPPNHFQMPPQRQSTPYLNHSKNNFPQRNQQINIPQNINNFAPRYPNFSNSPQQPYQSSDMKGQSTEQSKPQEMDTWDPVVTNLSETLYKHPLPRGCISGKPTNENTSSIPEGDTGRQDPTTPDTPSIETLDSVSSPSPSPTTSLTPTEMDTNELAPDARILQLPDGQDILLIMRDSVPHIATPLLYIVFPQLKRNQIDYTKNRHDLNLQPKPSTQPEVKVLRDHGMVGRKTFRCLLFSLSDVAKMVQKVDVPIPDCVQRVMDGEIPEERASMEFPVKLGNGFINKPVGNPEKQKHKHVNTSKDSNLVFDWLPEEDIETKFSNAINVSRLSPSGEVMTPLNSTQDSSTSSMQVDGLTIDTVVLSNDDLSKLPKFVDLPAELPEGLEELGAEFYSASEGQFYSSLTDEMGRVALLALSFRGFMICLKELYLKYLCQVGNRHTMKFKMRKLGITSIKATSWQRHKLVDLKALPSLCSICGLITLQEAKRLCLSYKHKPFPNTLDQLITLTDKKGRNGLQLSLSIPLSKLEVKPEPAPAQISGNMDFSTGEESDTTETLASQSEGVKKVSLLNSKKTKEKCKILKSHLSTQPLNDLATPTRAPKITKSVLNNGIATKKCKECGLIQSKFAKKCSQCHAYLQGSPCPKCQRLNIAYYSHCYSCFTKLDKNRTDDVIKPRGRTPKKKLGILQNSIPPVPLPKRPPGTITQPSHLSCIRCGRIRSTGKFNCLRCGTMFRVSSDHIPGAKEGVAMEMKEICHTNPDMKTVLDIFECLKELDLISVLIPLIQKIRIETLNSIETQEKLLNDLEMRQSTSQSQLTPQINEKEKIELKLTKLNQQQQATIEEIKLVNKNKNAYKLLLMDKEKKLVEKQKCVEDCEKFMKMLQKT